MVFKYRSTKKIIEPLNIHPLRGWIFTAHKVIALSSTLLFCRFLIKTGRTSILLVRHVFGRSEESFLLIFAKHSVITNFYCFAKIFGQPLKTVRRTVFTTRRVAALSSTLLHCRFLIKKRDGRANCSSVTFLVEVRRVELLSCIKTEKPSTYLVLLLISC